MSKEFYQTRAMFREYLHYENPYSYEDWMSVPEDKKAAWLYVQFFDEILLAWFKSKSFYANEQEGVETVLQYLMKNVPILESNKSRFTSRYIYRVAYNCLYCISHDRICDRDRYELETSNIVEGSECEINLFDMMSDDRISKEFDLHDKAVRARFWQIVDSDEDVKALVEHILNGKKLPFRGKRRECAFHALCEKLAPFKSYYYDN